MPQNKGRKVSSGDAPGLELDGMCHLLGPKRENKNKEGIGNLILRSPFLFTAALQLINYVQINYTSSSL